MTLNDFNYGILLKNLHTWENFSWARYGDGEWECMLKSKGMLPPRRVNGRMHDRRQNCDRHIYFTDMGHELLAVLNKPQRYYWGLQNLGKELYHKKIKDLLGLRFHEINWCESDTLHTASINGELEMFFNKLKEREVVLIGNQHLGKLNKFKFKHVAIPEMNCWNDRDRILEEVLGIAGQDNVILWCASMMTEVLMDKVFDELGNSVTQIDAGSVFDPYVGRQIRSYHKTLKV